MLEAALSADKISVVLAEKTSVAASSRARVVAAKETPDISISSINTPHRSIASLRYQQPVLLQPVRGHLS